MQTKDRQFKVTINCEMNGDLPSMVTNKHIIDKVESAVTEALGEVELWGEYYGDYDDIWAIFAGKVKVKIDGEKETKRSAQQLKNYKKGDTIIMEFHGGGVVSEEEWVISKIGSKYIHLDNDCDEDWKFDRKTGKCLNDNTYAGFFRTIKL